jgi:hypothetical protein
LELKEIIQNPDRRIIAALSIVSFAVAFVVHTSLTELWIRTTHKNGVPMSKRGESRMKIVGLAYDPSPNGRNLGTGYQLSRRTSLCGSEAQIRQGVFGSPSLIIPVCKACS